MGTRTPPATSGAADLDGVVRQRLRTLRLAQGMSLNDLAAATHLNASTISRLETGSRRLALDVLAPIARALNTTIDDLVDTSADDGDVVIRPERCELHGVTRWQLSRNRGPNGVNVVKMRLTPLETPPELQVHPGRDWFFVLSGTVKLFLGEREVLVHAGHAADFTTMTPHAFTAHLKPAEMISILDNDGHQAHTA
ncbi:helix-turn-helix domain-containing protein [Desertimonas flava]|uniref:helix-turn-helix domain-containing protein n=1 Tax=Desertimonas flava TaxID=2064846 RepID=UPI000E348B97|nr:XRE family transcriptional regulator [Desertimonas flava]